MRVHVSLFNYIYGTSCRHAIVRGFRPLYANCPSAGAERSFQCLFSEQECEEFSVALGIVSPSSQFTASTAWEGIVTVTADQTVGGLSDLCRLAIETVQRCGL
mmetsp:Transcript_27320/g.81842  ORF Transcript_27320/g.81842 Transcript_27320/m.81842 type:complete len:103 (-) Transcript_27320:2716-3024(-)